MQFSMSLLDLPSELQQEIIFWTIANDGPEAHLRLLLTNATLNESARAVAERGAIEYATNQHGHLAVTLLAHVPDQNLITQWIPHLQTVVSSIDNLLEYCQEKLISLSALAEPRRVAILNLLPRFDVRRCISVLKMGLYLTEAIRFRRQPSPTNVRAFLHALAPNGLLILHLTSMVLELCLHEEITPHIDSEAIRQAVRRDDLLMIQATQNELLTLGSQTCAAIVAPNVPRPDYLPAEAYDTLDRAHLIRDYQKSCDKVDEENDRRRNAKEQALKKFLKTLELMYKYQSFPAGSFQERQKPVIIATRIKESSGGSVPFHSAKLEDVRRMQALVMTELGDKSVLRTMKEFETAINLCRI